MYRIINITLLYWFSEQKGLCSNKISQYTYYIQSGAQNLEPFV